ncbi:SDR family NAD(P)-dependent oxidoreductase [Candidatus Pacearchaeota archaeon]|nr:SDR family NAD(P)-dependent oxidoreductase [Candidatus Pacearchaeota archaeon]
MLENKVAIVTGGSEGIGFGIASALASKGTRVYLVARTLEKLEKAKERITQQGGKVDIKSADITNIESMKEIVENVYRDNGRLDIFVNNAGAWKGQSLDTPFDDIWKLVEFDMKAPYQLAHYLSSRFRSEKENTLKILTVSSQAALQVMDIGLGYGPAKMGLVAGLFHLENELRQGNVDHVKLYRLYPNTVATEKMMGAIRSNQVQNPVKLESVVDTAVDLLLDKTPTRDVRIGYYPGKGIVRTYLPSNPDDFYHQTKTSEEVVDPDFIPEDLLK